MELVDVTKASCGGKTIVGMWLGRKFVWPDPWSDMWTDMTTEEVAS
jgi:hypothetical protein